MSLRNKIFLACESFLRVPPLILMDEIFRYSFGLGLNSKFTNYAATDLTSARSRGSDNSNETGDLGSDSEDKADVVETLGHTLSAEDTSWLSAAKPSISALWTTAVSDIFYPSSTLEDSSSRVLSSDAVIIEQSDQTPPSLSSHYFHVGIGEWSTFPQGVSEDFLSLIEVFGCLILFTALLVIFVLSTENLIKLYSFLISYLSLYLAYIYTPFPSFWSFPFIPSLVYNIFVRFVLAGLYFLTRSWPGINSNDDLPGMHSLLDSLTFALFFVTGVIRFEGAIYAVLVVGLQYSLWTKLPDLYLFLKTSLADTKRVRNEYGISHLIQVESGRLRINTVFRLFWCSKAAYDALYQFCNEPVELIFRHVVAHGTETLTGIIGLTVTVSAVCHQIGEFLLWVLYYGTTTESDANRFGSISTVLFFILSLQTGLTSLDPEKRLDRLLKNIVLLGTALFHALHQMLAPLLHAFRTFQALQIRAVVLSFSFLSISFFSTVCLIRSSTMSTWSLAVLALAIEFKIKIIISLFISVVVYLSQLVQYPDVLQKVAQALRVVLPDTVWRFFANLHDQVSHEDMVFYLKAIANVAEFITGIFLFVNAVWIFLFESASAIRAIGMSIHAYFNIWCESKKGWKIYCQRKTAAMKIMSLADATPEQLLEKRGDVCSICYEEMDSAKVTHCNHLFHEVCIRRWLYVQNTCPLCHEILYAEEAQQNNNPEVVPERGAEVRLPQNQENRPVLNNVVPEVNNEPELGAAAAVATAYTTYNGIRFYDLTQVINDESDADADDESSDGESELDEFGDATDNDDGAGDGSGGLSAFL